jgi:hypothetical protein
MLYGIQIRDHGWSRKYNRDVLQSYWTSDGLPLCCSQPTGEKTHTNQQCKILAKIRQITGNMNRQHNDQMKSLKIPKGGNQNPYIEEKQTTQWPKGPTTIYKTYK